VGTSFNVLLRGSSLALVLTIEIIMPPLDTKLSKRLIMECEKFLKAPRLAYTPYAIV
jgi:hypothetical protein